MSLTLARFYTNGPDVSINVFTTCLSLDDFHDSMIHYHATVLMLVITSLLSH